VLVAVVAMAVIVIAPVMIAIVVAVVLADDAVAPAIAIRRDDATGG